MFTKVCKKYYSKRNIWWILIIILHLISDGVTKPFRNCQIQYENCESEIPLKIQGKIFNILVFQEGLLLKCLWFLSFFLLKEVKIYFGIILDKQNNQHERMAFSENCYQSIYHARVILPWRLITFINLSLLHVPASYHIRKLRILVECTLTPIFYRWCM